MAILKRKKRGELSKEISSRLINIMRRELEEKVKKGAQRPAEEKPKISSKSIKPSKRADTTQGKKIEQIKGKSKAPLDISSIKKALEAGKEAGKQELVQDANFIRTGIPGFDELFEKGIPKGSAILVAGGAGSGKTLMCLHLLANKCKEGKRSLFMSFEESVERLKQHMQDFGWDVKSFEKEGRLVIQRLSPFEITRSVEAMLAKEKGELLIDVDPVILPEGFKPDIIVVDSLSSIASAFTSKEDSYRIYIEKLFRFFEKMGSTSFLITETEQIPTKFSASGVEEFLADGVIVIYNIRKGDVRENAIEILKLRGASHKKRIVAMKIVDNLGIQVYPEQMVFGLEEGERRV